MPFTVINFIGKMFLEVFKNSFKGFIGFSDTYKEDGTQFLRPAKGILVFFEPIFRPLL